MRLIVDGYGKFVAKRDNQIVIKESGKEVDYFLAEELTQVIITCKGSIGFDAINLLSSNAVDLVVLDWRGDITSKLYPPQQGTVKLRREQYKAYNDPRGAYLACKFIEAKLKNQKAILGTWAKSRNKSEKKSQGILNHRKKLSKYLNNLEKLETGIVDDLRNGILGIEGKAATEYWKGFKLSMNKNIGFEKRSGKGAEDGVNAMLNYGYGILQSEIWRNINLEGLDPYAGYLHADKDGRPSLVFDLMEEFRQQVVDKTVLKLINRNEIQKSDFKFEDNFCKISDYARKKLISNILNKLESKIKTSNKRKSWSNIISSQTHSLAKYLTDNTEYNGFFCRW